MIGNSSEKPTVMKNQQTKICSKCKKEKPLSEFYKQGGPCKCCVSERSAKYRQENADKLKEHRAKYYQENKDKKAKYYQENKDKKAKYHQKNADKIKEYQAKYRQENADKIKEYQAKYYQENADKITYEYIIWLLSSERGMSCEKIKEIIKEHPEIIQMKRESIIKFRKLKQLNHEIKRASNA